MRPPISTIPKRGSASCPRFDGCNAPICPLDDWQRAQHLQGERVCLWLREAVKPSGMARIAHASTVDIAVSVAKALPAIMASSGADLRHKLVAASRCGSKLVNMRAAREGTTLAAEAVPECTCGPATAHAVSRSGGIGEDHGRR
jgi:hypothetical protein